MRMRRTRLCGKLCSLEWLPLSYLHNALRGEWDTVFLQDTNTNYWHSLRLEKVHHLYVSLAIRPVLEFSPNYHTSSTVRPKIASFGNEIHISFH